MEQGRIVKVVEHVVFSGEAPVEEAPPATAPVEPLEFTTGTGEVEPAEEAVPENV